MAPENVEEALIGSDKASCTECWGCVRTCPSRAIRVVDRRSEVVSEKCVACGLCVSECRHGGRTVRDDTSRVWELLDSGRPVVAILASESVAAMHPMSAADVERALEHLGFYAVESTVLGEEMVALAYEKLCRRPAAFPVLRSTCSVMVEWVRRYHPALVQALAPVVPPYIAQARLVRALYPEDIAIVYVSPCFARKDEIAEDELAGAVDVAIDFGELKRMIDSGRGKAGAQPPEDGAVRRPVPLKEFSLTDGFPRDILAEQTGVGVEVLVLRGLRQVDAALCGVERGESGPVIADMLMCEGCIDGPAVNPHLSVFAKRNIEASERDSRTPSLVSSRTLLRQLPQVDLLRSFKPQPVAVPRASDEDLDSALAEGGFASREEVIDCGACGYPTCVEHAEAIWRGDSSWEMCPPLQRKLLDERSRALAENSTLDAVTGLWNRRVFEERLVDEMARFDRYGTPVSLLMPGLDGFGGVGEALGSAADEMLAAVGRRLREVLRVTDLPARYDAVCFAVILPGMAKTHAFAVAEKLREALGVPGPEAGAEGYRQLVPLTVSVGVASASKPLDRAAPLIAAAGAALLQAKEAGGDQVRLS